MKKIASYLILLVSFSAQAQMIPLSRVTGLSSSLSGKVPTSRILTINGVGLDLSTDRSWTIASSPDTAVYRTTSNSYSKAQANTLLAAKADASTVAGKLNTANPTYTGIAQNSTVVNENISGKTFKFIGDSHVQGFGATSNSFRFSTLLCNYLGLTESNSGSSGTSVSGTATSLIPTYNSSTYKYLLIGFGTNDSQLGGGYTTTQFETDYTAYINNAISTKGWPAANIFIISIPGSALLLPGTFPTWNASIVNVANATGVNYVELYDALINNGGALFNSADNTHMNNVGHSTAASLIYAAIKQPYNISAQKLAVNGTSQFNALNYLNPPFLTQGTFKLLGVNSTTGSVGVVNTLPDNTRTNGTFIADGQIIWKNALVPTTATTTDIVMANTGRIMSAASATANKTAIEVADALGYMNLRNYYSAGGIRFYNSGGVTGTQTLSLTLGADLSAIFGGNVKIPLNSTIGLVSGFQANNITVGDAAGTTLMQNLYTGSTTGGFNFTTAPVTSGTGVRTMKLFSSGNLLLHNGGTPVDISSAQLTLSNTSKGFLKNVVTTTQRDAIASNMVQSLIITNGGSGYSSAPTASLSGGGGSGAVVSVGVTGGVVTTVSLLGAGTGYTSAPTITLSGGGGSGAAISAIMVPVGLEVYNSTTKNTNIFDGTRWTEEARSLTGSATLDFASTAAQTSSELTIAVVGAADGDVVNLGIPNAASNANTCYTARVSAPDVVTVKFNNYSSGAVDPASGTFRVSVVKY